MAFCSAVNKGIEAVWYRNRIRVVKKNGVNLVFELIVHDNRIPNKRSGREKRYDKSNENVSIFKLILNKRMLSFSREEAVGIRILTEFRVQCKQIIVEFSLEKVRRREDDAVTSSLGLSIVDGEERSFYVGASKLARAVEA